MTADPCEPDSGFRRSQQFDGVADQLPTSLENERSAVEGPLPLDFARMSAPFQMRVPTTLPPGKKIATRGRRNLSLTFTRLSCSP